MTLSAIILLIAANIFWAGNPTAAKIIIREVGNVETAWLKYFVAGISFLISLPLIHRVFPETEKDSRWLPDISFHDLAVIFMIAITTCFLSPLLQMKGLRASSATANSLLVGMEPLLTLTLAYFVINNPLAQRDVLALIIGFIGFLILSGFFNDLTVDDPLIFLKSWSGGDFLLLCSILCEACYSVFPKKLTKRYPGFQIYGTALGIGLVMQTIFLLTFHGLPKIKLLTAGGWCALIWLGVLGTTFTYLAWIKIIQSKVSLSAAVATLFLQPIFGALAGISVLRESFHMFQLEGATLILAAVSWRALEERNHTQPALPLKEEGHMKLEDISK